MSIVLLSVAMLLIVLNGFFVAVEFAAMGASRPTIEQWAAEGTRRGARAARTVQHRLSEVLAGAQLGITAASLALGFVGEPTIAHLIEDAIHRFVEIDEGTLHTIGFLIALSIVAMLHMVLGEMVPKNLAIAGAERSLLILAPPMLVFNTVLGPIIGALNGLANGILWLLRIEPRDELDVTATADDLLMIVGESHSEGLIDAETEALLSGALGFSSTTVDEVMIATGSVVSVGRAWPAAQVADAFATSRHTRLPVDAGDAGRYLGFLHAVDLLDIEPDALGRPVPGRLVRALLTVPSGTILPDVLVAMRSARAPIAAVTGPDGAPAGIVTLDEVVNALVGRVRVPDGRREASAS